MNETERQAHEELVQQLEKVTGQRFRTPDDIHAYVAQLATRSAVDGPSLRRWRTAKRAALSVLLLFAVIQYHLLDVLLEIASLPSLTVFVPVRVILS